ncbi:hypothetical protein A0O34_19895 [Chryseobacterium glaciei]|uniref:Uncharacterized protein n=1 Tax=Chryseobacterium glaciei TaxID=1685010 RepID=A0A172Y089_9FLAO|nr:hypothetical protein A0O34_19895 [Chryseobacterium glaciei]
MIFTLLIINNTNLFLESGRDDFLNMLKGTARLEWSTFCSFWKGKSIGKTIKLRERKAETAAQKCIIDCIVSELNFNKKRINENSFIL